MVPPFVTIHNLELIVLVKLINLMTKALLLHLNTIVLNLEYIIINLNMISDKLLKMFPMNKKFLDNFNQGVIGYYIGLIGVYFAVLIVAIQMYKDKRYLGKEISKEILTGKKKNISMVNWIWVISACFIVITIFFQAINDSSLVLFVFIIYFVYMACWIAKYIDIMIFDNYKESIKNDLSNEISKKDSLIVAKSIKFNNRYELEEILDFFIEKATDEKYIIDNKKIVSVFYYLSETILDDKYNIMFLLRKINKIDDTYILRKKYVNLKINHSKLAVFIKYNFNDENFDDYYEVILKIIENQIHLTEIGFEYYPDLFYKYFSAFINNKNLSIKNKNIIVKGLSFILDEIAISSNSDTEKVKYHVDYIKAVVLLNIDVGIDKMVRIFSEKNSGFMSYVVIMTCIVLYIEDRADYAKKYGCFLSEAIKNISVEKFDFYLKEIKETIIHFENGMSIFNKKVDNESESRLQLATQYIFIEKYLNTKEILKNDVRMFKELNSYDLNKVAKFLGTSEKTDKELIEYKTGI